MNGQAVNVDWVVGLSVFLVSLIASTSTVVQSYDFASGSTVESKAEFTAESLKSAATNRVSLTPLYVRQPHDIGRIAVDRTYHPEKTGSVYVNSPSRINVEKRRLVAVLETGNESYRITSFQTDVEKNFETNVSGGEMLENSDISVNPESGGLSSINLNGEEYLETRVDLGESGESTETHGIYGSAYDRVKIYTGSQEIIFENLSTTFHFRNFSKLYWAPDKSTTTLSGEKTFKSENTKGFVLAGLDSGDYAATFTGDMNATVYQDGEPGTKVEINASRARLMLHRDGLSFGRKRVANHISGEIYLGVSEEISAATDSSLDGLQNSDRREFERRFNLRSYGYNITGAIDRGSEIPLQPVSVESRLVPKTSWNGSLKWSTLKVSIWQ